MTQLSTLSLPSTQSRKMDSMSKLTTISSLVPSIAITTPISNNQKLKMSNRIKKWSIKTKRKSTSFLINTSFITFYLIWLLKNSPSERQSGKLLIHSLSKYLITSIFMKPKLSKSTTRSSDYSFNSSKETKSIMYFGPFLDPLVFLSDSNLISITSSKRCSIINSYFQKCLHL